MADKNKKGSGGFLIMIIIGAIILIGGGLAIAIAYNPGNINENVLSKVPVIKSFVPVKKEEIYETLEEKYYDYSKPRLKDTVFTLEKEKILANEQIEKLKTESAEKTKEIDKLKEYEKLYLTLKQEKEQFSTIVANQDKKGFAAYYEKVNPELAKKIYTEITKSKFEDEQTKKYIATLESMSIPLVASMLDDMAKTDFEQVVKLIQTMDQERSVKILEKMDIKNTTKITKKLTGGVK